MLKKTVNYTDLFDGTEKSLELHFHIAKTDILKNLVLADRLEKFRDSVIGIERELTTPEKQEMVDLIEEFARLGYGVRTETGGFRKDETAWSEFRWSAAWDAFFWGLFEDPKEFDKFMNGILPADALAEAKKQIEAGGTNLDEMSAEQLKARLAELEAKKQ